MAWIKTLLLLGESDDHRLAHSRRVASHLLPTNCLQAARVDLGRSGAVHGLNGHPTSEGRSGSFKFRLFLSAPGNSRHALYLFTIQNKWTSFISFAKCLKYLLKSLIILPNIFSRSIVTFLPVQAQPRWLLWSPSNQVIRETFQFFASIFTGTVNTMQRILKGFG